MQDFEYHRPVSVAQAQALLQSSDAAKLIAGGQTLVPTMKQGLAAPDAIISLKSVVGLARISGDDRGFEIGAMATHADVAADPIVSQHLPGLAALARGIGDRHIRNRGTLGGSIANCDPAADYPAALLALNASIHTDRRAISADEFFLGLFTTALEEDEIIDHVRFKSPARLAYRKFSNPASRYAIVGVAVTEISGEIRVAVTGAGSDGVFRWHEAEERLYSDFSAAAIADLQSDHAMMMSDIHASAEYRAALVKIMTARAVEELASSL
jgi:aerobic carbon-monoxide dehydrogenase medium subunit